MKILVVNAGSSSHKLALYDLENEEPVDPLWEGSIDWGGERLLPLLVARACHGAILEQQVNLEKDRGVSALLESLWKGETRVIGGLHEVECIGHRVVHGGADFTQPVRISPAVKQRIRQLFPLAPLHNPANLQGIENMERLFPGVPQWAVFDTAFHTSMPEAIKTYPVPLEWKQWGIQRYGFHGISHHYCAVKIAQWLPLSPGLKIINCHLGNGCSLCAIREGKSHETTMGFTPLEGLMMGTRCGSIDPGILLYLLRERHFSDGELDRSLNFDSGLKGVGGSSDMRELLAMSDEGALLAIEMFVHRLTTSIGALSVSLNGCDVLSFTGGIGEHAVRIREEACRRLACLGMAIDEQKNRDCHPDADITGASSRVRVVVVRTREEWMIARACLVT